MSKENLEIIEKIYAAFDKRDYEGAMSHFAEDFEWYAADNSPLADQSPFYGVEAVRIGVFARIDSRFDKLVVVADEIFEADEDRVVVLGYYHGKFRVKTEEFRTQVAHIWTLRDGKAVKYQQYLDTLKFAKDSPE